MQQNPSADRNLPSMPILSLSSMSLPGEPKTHPLPPGVAKTLLRALLRRWLLAGSLALMAAVALAGLVWNNLVEQYRAEACLHVPPPAALVHDEELAHFRRSQASLAQSPAVLAAGLRQPDAAKLPDLADPASALVWLQQHLHVETTPAQDLLRMQVRSQNPDAAVGLARAVAAAYVQEAGSQRQKALDDEQEACRRARAQLLSQRDKLARWERNTSLLTLERDLQQAAFNLRATQVELAQLQKQGPGPEEEPSEKAVLDFLSSDPAQHQALHELAALDEQIQAVLRVSARGPSDPLARKLKARHDQARQQIEARKQEVRQELGKKLGGERRAEHQAQLGRLRERLRLWQKLETEVQGRLNKHGQEGNEQQRRALQEEIRADSQALARRETELETARKGPAISWPGEAVTVHAERRTLRWLAAGAAALVGAMLMLLLVAWGEAQRRQITAGSQVTHGLGLRVLGRIPAASAQVRAASLTAATDGKDHNAFAEAVDALRTMLLCDGAEAPQIILVTSAGHGEGKTSLAVGLAASLARGWRKTLLIDGDLRKPEAHTLLGVPLEPGLSEVLRDEVDLAEVIQPTAIGRLWVLPAGHGDAHAIASLAQSSIAPLFDHLRQQYDCIVIDGCPVLSVADSLMLSRHADVAVLAVRSGFTHLSALQAARQQLAGLNVLTPGVVLLGRDDDLRGVPTTRSGRGG
jgi:capsular exopolysaccharide synthesis family protein